MKKILFFLISFFSLWISFSYSWNFNTWNCENYTKLFNINWHNIVKIWTIESYNVSWINNINWSIIKQNKVLLTSDDTIFKHNFISPWNVLLEWKFTYSWCNIVLKKKINVYKTIILFLNSINTNFIKALDLKRKGIYVKNISLENLKQNSYFLNKSDYIFISQQFIIPFFSKFKIKWDYDNKKIVLFIWSFKWFYAKLLIPYTKNLLKNIYIYDKNNLLNILSNIYQWKDLDIKNNLYNRNIWNSFYLPLSFFVGKLISAWISIKIIGLILVAIMWIIIVSFLRQIIWFSIFWLYTPVLLSMLMLVFGYYSVIILFIISIFAILINYFITKRIYILYGSKIALNYMIYTILSIIIIWLLVSFGYIKNISINMNWLILFFIIPLLTKSLIKEDTKIFSKSFIYLFIEFIFILLILLFIYNISILQYILVAYPDILWLFIPINIFIWRFTWLQLLEYIRFYPLIKKNIYEEE